jgi:RNA polymerase sigma factor (TIGR02999 family)
MSRSLLASSGGAGALNPGSHGPCADAAGDESDHLITRLLRKARDGDPTAVERLLPLVYEELRCIAQRQLRRQRAGHTLSSTALVHEAYLKLVDQMSAGWTDRAHFFGVAARAMRQILINYAYKHGAAKRGAGWRRIPLDEAVLAVEDQAAMLLALDEALTRLARLNERLSRLVEYRFFGGMTEEEAATALGVSARTVRRDWLKARLWLYTELAEDPPRFTE